VGHDPRVAADLLRPLRVAEQVRVVAVLPDEDQGYGRHEHRHERAPGGWAGEGIRRDAEPPGAVVLGVVCPELFFGLELDVDPLIDARLAHLSSLAIRIAARNSWRRR